MSSISVKRVTLEGADVVFDLVDQLLRELGEEGDESGTLDRGGLTRAWRSDEARQFAFVAFDGDAPAGVATVAEAFAIYANGHYGIINEMYVAPGYRSGGVGGLLVDAVKALGRERGWRRVDVTAPESERWARTRRFYERNGFRFTGPKLKSLLS